MQKLSIRVKQESFDPLRFQSSRLRLGAALASSFGPSKGSKTRPPAPVELGREILGTETLRDGWTVQELRRPAAKTVGMVIWKLLIPSLAKAALAQF